MPSFATPHDTSLTGNATQLILGMDGVTSTYVITNVQLAFANPNAGNNTNTQIDIAHLGQTTGETAARMDPPLIVPSTGNNTTGRQVTFDYVGKVVLSDAATGTYKITVAGVTLLGGTTASYHTVSSSSLTLKTNDAIRGQAVLSIAR